LRRNRPRLSDQSRIEAPDLDAPVPQRRLEAFASRRRPGFVAAVPVHGVGAGLIQQLVDDKFGWPASQHQRVAALAQAVSQGAERSVKPPARGAAQSPFAGVEIIENENGDDRATAGDRSRQGGVIREPQIPTEPKQGKHGRHFPRRVELEVHPLGDVVARLGQVGMLRCRPGECEGCSR